MLRNKSRAVSSKQALMADQTSLSSTSQNQTRPISSFLVSPRFFNGFLANGRSQTETRSPTSVLDRKLFSTLSNQTISHHKNQSTFPNIFSAKKHSWEEQDPASVGLALVDSLNDEKIDQNISQPNSKIVLFGSNLKIQIPPLPPSFFSPIQTPKSPTDFGIKTQKSPLLNSSSPFGSADPCTQTRDSPQSVGEMDLSEDYTCVISHGSNPKTTHIYHNCILESCYGGVGLPKSKPKNYSPPEKSPESFLKFCYTCKKDLEQGKDIFMYRGEKAFCSRECRNREMLFDEEENHESDKCL